MYKKTLTVNGHGANIAVMVDHITQIALDTHTYGSLSLMVVGLIGAESPAVSVYIQTSPYKLFEELKLFLKGKSDCHDFEIQTDMDSCVTSWTTS